MRYEIKNLEDGVSQITLSGDVDLETSSTLRKAMLDALAHSRHLRVDLAGVRVIDSSGVASLIEAFQAARKKGKTFALTRVPPVVERVLKLAKLDTVFPVDAD